MLISFLNTLRAAGLNTTLREFLDLLEALQHRLAYANMEEFYFLSRACLVKDEKYFDRFDLAFSQYFDGLQDLDSVLETLIPDEWLRKEFEKALSAEEKKQIESLGGLQELLDAFKERLKEQKERHAGGSKWIGTGGTSPFGAYGYNPEGIRIGQDSNRNYSAVKVWDKREFKNFDDSVEVGTRNLKVALRRLRQFARTGAADELDLDGSIRSTARNGGYLDLKLIPERHNAVKVLLFMDVGGSMDRHVRECEELFSAARSEFKHLKHFYFHNFVYEKVWTDNQRRTEESIPLWDVLHTYDADYRVIFIGDASMSGYEIAVPGGSVDHWNEEPGATWFQRISAVYPKLIWLNPTHQESWNYIHSISMVKELTEERMYPLTLAGLEEGIAYLSR